MSGPGLIPVANRFPAIWFETFLSPGNAAPVDRELAFVQAYLPVAEYPRLLDVACGIGRHSGPLAALGYDVLGIDRSEMAIGMAREQHPGVEFRQLDMFDLATLDRTFDGILCLWQSFGYGTTEQNQRVLGDMRRLLRPGGRILLDIYNADAAATLPPLTTERRGGRTIRTRRIWLGRRMGVEIEYSDSNETDRHEWEVYTPAELEELAADIGLDVLVRCAWFDPALPPGRDHLRMQLLLERRG